MINTCDIFKSTPTETKQFIEAHVKSVGLGK